VPEISTTPVDIAAQFGVAEMTLSWPADHIGWRLQAQTNVAGLGMSGDWFDVPGATQTNEIILPVDTSAGSVFYRLIYP
jgi:hypothetical protein